MRRDLAAAAMGVLLCAAACSDTSAFPGAAPAPGAGTSEGAWIDPSVAKSADAALSGNTKAICDQATRAGAAFGKAFIADLQLQIEAAGKSAQAGAEAKQKIERDVSNYSYALADMAKLADNAALKAALKRMSKQVTVLKGDVTKINATKMSAVSATLDKACGKG